MDFHKAISVDNSDSDKLFKTFIFYEHCHNSIYILRVFVADRMQICLALRRGKVCIHTDQQLSN